MKLTWRIWLMLAFLVAALLFMVNFDGLTTSGVIVSSLDLNSTESASGLSTGDIITAVNNKKISNLEDYSNEITKLNYNGQREREVIS